MKIALFANTDWYLYGFRLDLARRLKTMGNEVHLICPAGQYHTELVREGFIWHEIQLSRKGINPFKEISALFHIIQLYRQIRFDVCHHFTIKSVIYGSLAAKVVQIPRVINSITGLGYVFGAQHFSGRVIKSIAVFLYRFALKATRVVFQNQENFDLFVSTRIIHAEQGVLIQGSGVDTDKFSYTPEPASSIPTVTMVCRLLWEKGVGDFIEAASIVNSQGEKAHFLLVGDIDTGNPGSIPQKQIELWQAEGIIEWVGWQKEMREIYRLSHIVCLPSYSEGLPKALLEAGASGRPAVTSDIPGCRDVVQDGVNGLLFPPKDIPALVRALGLLIDKPNLRTRYGRAGRKRVVEKFSLELINTQTIGLYFP